MPFEAIVLGLVCAVRPTASAVIYALLNSRAPRRALATYLLAGFAFSATVGIAIVAVFHDVVGFRRAGTPAGIVDLVIAAAAFGVAAGARNGRLARWSGNERRESPAWVARLREPSPRMLVAAGVGTHLPGLFYLAALNLIIVGGAGFVSEATQVLVFNGLWYSTGAAALAAFILRPAGTRHAVDALRAWLAAHERAVLVGVGLAVGVYFLLSGLDILLG